MLLELLARQRASNALHDLDSPLRLYVDRLVIHQALSGLNASWGVESQKQNGVDLDDVQRFWQAMEEVCVRSARRRWQSS